VWQCLENVRGLVGVPALWRSWLGGEFDAFSRAFLRKKRERAKSFPCPRECGCAHEIIERSDGSLVAVCCCEPWNCDDFAVTLQDLALLELDWPRLGRALCAALKCDLRESHLGLRGARQIGAFSAATVPVVLTIQNERNDFRNVVAELVARWRQPFILFAPTSRFMDGPCCELLATCKAEFFDVESHVILTPQGNLRARKPAGELFARFSPDAKEPVPESVARQIFALVEKLEGGKRMKEPSPLKVFMLYCGRELTAQQVAVECGCAKGTVVSRLKMIRNATGVDPDKLRAYSPHLQNIEEDITDSRAKRIHRKATVDAPDDDGDENF
jgi:hypothetical protein